MRILHRTRLTALLTTLLTTAALTVTVAGAPAEATGLQRSKAFDIAGLWTFDEGRGQRTFDWSFSGNSGQLGSSPAADASDPEWIRLSTLFFLSTAALRFNGTQRVTVPNAPSLEPDGVTVAARLRSTGPGAFRYVMSKGAFTCEHASYGLYTNADGNLAFYVSDGQSVTMSAAASPAMWDGKWHTVLGAFNGSTVRLWVDGVQVGADVAAPVKVRYGLPDGQDFLIGDYAGPCGNALGFVGDIDGAALIGRYDRSLSPVG